MSRYEIVIGHTSKTVDLERSIDSAHHFEAYRCRVLDDPGSSGSGGGESSSSNSNTHRVIVERRDPHFLLISIDDKMYSLRQSRRSAYSVDFISNGKRIHAHFPRGILRGDATAKTTADGTASVNELVTAKFPAKVISIKVSRGSKVKEGETLLILEAMKMEAQVKAPKNCTVLEVFVHEGEIVPRGIKLMQLKFAHTQS